MYFNNATTGLYSIYVRQPFESGKNAACFHEGDCTAGHAITHVQTHVQSTVQLIARASEHCVIHSSPCNASKQYILTINVTRLYDSIYLRLSCEPGKKVVS